MDAIEHVRFSKMLLETFGSGEPYLTREQFQKFMNVGRSTVRDWIQQGMPVLRLNPAKPHSHFRIPLKQAVQWIKNRCNIDSPSNIESENQMVAESDDLPF